MSQAFRFPAEWEPQSAVLLAWPHAGTDWAERLDAVESTYVALVGAITRFQAAIVCVADTAIEEHARQRLVAAGVTMAAVRFVRVGYDDTWLRDSGPISLRSSADDSSDAHNDADRFKLLDFRFTGWGGKFEASRDDALVEALFDAKLFLNSIRQIIDFALEGGAIETDGAGTLLTTWRCLHERHPDAAESELGDKLKHWLGLDRVLWLHHGYLEGDDTDAHVDTLARLAPHDAIVFQSCDDPTDPHHDELAAMADEIAQLRTVRNRPYRLFPLPWPRPIVDGGRRLAASYANFLIINGAVLMPAYDDPADAAAAAQLARAFPGREIVPVPCRALIWQNGSLHCVTMQLPQGVVQ